MGFYARKSVKVGPFRFNLSKSGVGVSAGVPGFRVGTGPRGNYVHVGSHGLYYRATLGGQPGRQPGLAPATHPTHPAFVPNDDVIMQDVTGVASMELQPTGGGDVVTQLNAAASRHAWWWPTAITLFVLGLVAAPIGGPVLWLLAVPACWWLYLRDKTRRTVVLFYDVNDAPAAWFDRLVEGWRWLTDSKRLWRVVQAGHVVTTQQRKVHAGASMLVRRIPVSAGIKGPKHLATNVVVPSITAGSSSLHFLPDRVLVFDGKRYSDVSYAQLTVAAAVERFIEDGTRPSDAVQVDQTWQYVNKSGGPDRRYANNRVLPVMLYGVLEFTSPAGLQWHVQVSKSAAAAPIAELASTAPAMIER